MLEANGNITTVRMYIHTEYRIVRTLHMAWSSGFVFVVFGANNHGVDRVNGGWQNRNRANIPDNDSARCHPTTWMVGDLLAQVMSWGQ